jgi:autotransporter-associated beta strand protein
LRVSWWVAGVLVLILVPAAPASAANDVTGAIRANRDVVLAGDAVVTLAAGTTTYTGVISGEGTLTVAGSGRLVLTKDSDFTLPKARQRQKVVTGWSGDSYAVTTISNPDPPAVIVKRGATLQYGPGTGAAGVVGHYPYSTPGFQLNGLNIRVDGTLDIAAHRKVNLGILSGSGFVIQRRFTWDGLALAGAQPFAGVIYNGTGVDLGSPYYTLQLPNVRKIVNQGSAIVGSPTGHRHVIAQDFYSRRYGNDINFNFPLSKRALVVMTGVYSWADSGPDSDPSLSDPSLNYETVPHSDNKRGVNIEGSNVQWGDGTHNRFFLPGNSRTVYINLHERRGVRGRLTFDYNGPVTLGAPISGGRYHDTLNAPGAGDVVIAATKGNAVTFAAPQNYDGSTTIGKGASLRLGTGKSGGDGSLLVSPRYKVVNNGTLVVENTRTAVSLSRISGTGSLTQAGTATTTLTGQTTYTGTTTVSAGTLVLAAGTLAASRGIDLTRSGATLDLSRAGAQTVQDLAGAAGSTVRVGKGLTAGSARSTTFGGAVTGGGAVTKAGTGTLTLTGASATGGPWTVRQGTLRLGDPKAEVKSPVRVEGGATLAGCGTVGQLTSAATVAAGCDDGTPLAVDGDYAQSASGTLAGRLRVRGTVTLAGAFTPPAGAREPVTVVDNTGEGRVDGTFDGLAEGATVQVGGVAMTLTYRGGDGNDVVLTPPRGVSAGAAAPASSGAVTLIGVLLLGLGLALVAAAAVLLVLRRRATSRL